MRPVIPATLRSAARVAIAGASVTIGPRRTSRSVETTGVTSIAHICYLPALCPLFWRKIEPKTKAGEPGCPDSPLRFVCPVRLVFQGRNRRKAVSLLGLIFLGHHHVHVGAVV